MGSRVEGLVQLVEVLLHLFTSKAALGLCESITVGPFGCGVGGAEGGECLVCLCACSSLRGAVGAGRAERGVTGDLVAVAVGDELAHVLVPVLAFGAAGLGCWGQVRGPDWRVVSHPGGQDVEPFGDEVGAVAQPCRHGSVLGGRVRGGVAGEVVGALLGQDGPDGLARESAVLVVWGEPAGEVVAGGGVGGFV